MNLDHLDRIVARQSELIAALIALDAAAITVATEGLAAAISLAKNDHLQSDKRVSTERIAEAFQSAHSASIRINYLMHWTRQRTGRIAELRGHQISGYRASY
jgi:antirestriction protein ArdC